MKSITTNILAVLVLVAIVFSFYAMLQTAPKTEAAGFQVTTIGVATTSAAFSVTTSARVLATTTNALGDGTSYTRVYASICNPNANPVALNLDGDKLANSSTGKATVMIGAAAGYNVCYEITDRNQYSGSITASSTNQTATAIFVKEYVQ